MARAAAEDVAVVREPPLLYLSFDRPRVKNAIRYQTYTEMADALDAAEEDEEILAVIITGNPAAGIFTAGADLRDPSAMEDLPEDTRKAGAQLLTRPVGRYMQTLLRFPKLVIAAVNGPAVGIGVTLLTHCDLVYATPKATFRTPFFQLALAPEFCSSDLFTALMGQARANELLLLGRAMDAGEAQLAGLVSRILPEERFIETVESIASEICSQPFASESLREFKRLTRRTKLPQLERVMTAELDVVGRRIAEGQVAEAAMAVMSTRNKSKITAKLRSRL